MGVDAHGQVSCFPVSHYGKRPDVAERAGRADHQAVPSPLAARIKELADERRLTLRGLAAKARVGANVVLQLSAGNTQAPRRDNIVKIAHALEVDPLELLDLAGMLTEEDRWAQGRPTFAEFVQSPHLPLTRGQRRTLVDIYESWVGRGG